MMNNKNNIGIFGGTFNPIQIAHLIISERFIEEFKLHKCILIPTNISPFKVEDSHTIVESKHRFKMLKLAIKKNCKYTIDDFEIKSGGISHTIDTIHHIKKKYENDNLFLLIGSDHSFLFDKWYKWEEILKLVQIVIALRPKTLAVEEINSISQKLTIGNKPPMWLDAPLIEISASEIRQRIAQGKSIKYLVPKKVEKYILKHKLFKN